MKIIKNPEQIQKLASHLRAKGKSIGFVPTMGALHEGHLSLVRRARSENDIVIASIFVNPSQFGPKEDLSRYPRPFEKDRRLLAGVKTDFLFYPNAAAIYPEDFSSWVEVNERITSKLCGAFRPGHFRGVATVVAKLFHLTQPHRAYFGAKDFQQTVVIGRMIEDLSFPLQLKVLPTVREKDGLAMSSRNAYLSGEERKRALAVSKTLFGLRAEVAQKPSGLRSILIRARKKLSRAVDRIDYLTIVDPKTLEELRLPRPEMLAAAAVYVGKTRLIDNVIIRLH